jgi:multicomponent Na+:H+ antiporter subunit B
MTEIYLRLVDLVLTPVILLVAVALFLRGHDMPGGGFIAGLTVAAAIELHILARGAPVVRRRYGRFLVPLVGLGLVVAVSAALIGLLGGGFFRGMWIETYVGDVKVKVGTPQLFDLGVMLVVVGMGITYLLGLGEESTEAAGGDADGEEEGA